MYSYKKHILFPLLLGMVSGSLFFLLEYDKFDESDIISNIFINNFDVNSSTYVTYLVRQRIITLVVFLIVVILVSYKPASLIFNYIIGIYYGIMASALFIQCGYSSYRLMIYMFFSQGILYFVSMYMAGVLFFNNKYSDYLVINKSNKFNYFVKIIVVVVLLILSIGFEIFFSEKFL